MSPVNKCTGHRKYVFPNPYVMVFFFFIFPCCDMYYNLSQYWALSFLANTNKCTEFRKYAFPDPCVIVFFMLWYILPPLTILVTLVFSHYEQVYRTQKVCVSGPMCNCLFFSRLWYVLPSVAILVTLVFSHYEQVCRTLKVCISGPMFILFFLFFIFLFCLTVSGLPLSTSSGLPYF